MADVWISTGRRYCEICKVWFGNNKASQDHHERGDRHKAMLANRIRQTMQKGKKQEQANAKLNATLAQMGAAASASLGRGTDISTGLNMNIFDPKQHKDVSAMAKEMAARRDNLKRGLSGAAPPPSGGEPSMKVTKDDVVSAYRDLTNPMSRGAQGPALPEAFAANYIPENQKKCAEICWVRARSTEGTYYWNLFDGTTRTEPPNYFYTEEEYERKVNEFEENRKKNYYGLDEVKAVRNGMKDVESYIKQKIEESGYSNLVEKNKKELNIVDRTDRGKKAEKRRRWEEKQKKAQELKEQELQAQQVQQAPIYKPLNMESLLAPPPPPPPPPPKYEVKHFHPTRKSDEQIHKKENDEVAAVKEELIEDQEDVEPSTNSEKSEVDEHGEEGEETKPSVSSFPIAPAIGGWIRITQEEKEKANVPFESPLTARYREEEEKEKMEEEIRNKTEPKIEFEEKTAATMTKKVKGPIEFKKKKVTSRNIRKRDE